MITKERILSYVGTI